MRAALTVIVCATLPLAAGFAFPAASLAQGMQYEGPYAGSSSAQGGVNAVPLPVTGSSDMTGGQPSYPAPGAAMGGTMNASGMGGTPAENMTRSAQMEQQIRELTNQLEQRDYQLRQLQQNFDNYKTDMDQRLQTLEQRSGNASSGVISGTENLPQSTDGSYVVPNQPGQPVPQNGSAQAGATPNGAAQGGTMNASGGASAGTSGVTGTVDDPNAPFRPSNTPQLGQITETAPNANGGAVTSGRPQGGAAPANAAQAYDQAFAYLQQSNYQDAQRAFTEFLKTYAKHPLAANAQYWLGEAYFAQTQYSVAAKTFAKAFQDHPQGQKAPDALLKLALTLEKMNKKDDACLTLGELNKRFPSGPASVLRRGTEEATRMGCKV